jgi:hypothetical protein
MRAVPKFNFDPVHRPCRCKSCAYRRVLRMLRDLDAEFGPVEFETAPEPKKERIQ